MFLGDSGRIFSTGFSRGNERQYAVWDAVSKEFICSLALFYCMLVFMVWMVCIICLSDLLPYVHYAFIGIGLFICGRDYSMCVDGLFDELGQDRILIEEQSISF